MSRSGLMRGTLATVAVLLVAAAGSDVLRQRAEQIARLPAVEQQQLLEKFERYQQLSEAERERLRQLDRDLAADPAGAELRALAMRYEQWLSQLPAAQRNEILSTPSDKRIDKLAEVRRVDMRFGGRRLSPSDAAVMADALEAMLRRMPSADAEKILKRLAMQQMGSVEMLRLPLIAELGKVRDQLSPAAREQLNAAAAPQQKSELFLTWLRQALGVLVSRNAASGRGDANPERLRQLFDSELTETDRQMLLTLPAEEMRQSLWRLYQLRSLVPSGNSPSEPGRRPPGGLNGPGRAGSGSFPMRPRNALEKPSEPQPGGEQRRPLPNPQAPNPRPQPPPES